MREKKTELWDINSEFWEKTSPNCEIKVNSAVESGFHILIFVCVNCSFKSLWVDHELRWDSGASLRACGLVRLTASRASVIFIRSGLWPADGSFVSFFIKKHHMMPAGVCVRAVRSQNDPFLLLLMKSDSTACFCKHYGTLFTHPDTLLLWMSVNVFFSRLSVDFTMVKEV